MDEGVSMLISQTQVDSPSQIEDAPNELDLYITQTQVETDALEFGADLSGEMSLGLDDHSGASSPSIPTQTDDIINLVISPNQADSGDAEIIDLVEPAETLLLERSSTPVRDNPTLGAPDRDESGADFDMVISQTQIDVDHVVVDKEDVEDEGGLCEEADTAAEDCGASARTSSSSEEKGHLISSMATPEESSEGEIDLVISQTQLCEGAYGPEEEVVIHRDDTSTLEDSDADSSGCSPSRDVAGDCIPRPPVSAPTATAKEGTATTVTAAAVTGAPTAPNTTAALVVTASTTALPDAPTFEPDSGGVVKTCAIPTSVPVYSATSTSPSSQAPAVNAAAATYATSPTQEPVSLSSIAEDLEDSPPDHTASRRDSSVEWIEAARPAVSTARPSLPLPLQLSKPPLVSLKPFAMATSGGDTLANATVDELKKLAESVTTAMTALVTGSELSAKDIAEQIDAQMKKLQTIKDLITKASQVKTPLPKAVPAPAPAPATTAGWDDDDYTQFSVNLCDKETVKDEIAKRDDWEGFGTADCAEVLSTIAASKAAPSRDTLATPASASKRKFNSLEVVAKSEEAQAFIRSGGSVATSAERKKQVFRRRFVSPSPTAGVPVATKGGACSLFGFDVDAEVAEPEVEEGEEEVEWKEDVTTGGGRGATSRPNKKAPFPDDPDLVDSDDEWQDDSVNKPSPGADKKATSTRPRHAKADHVHTKSRSVARPKNRKIGSSSSSPSSGQDLDSSHDVGGGDGSASDEDPTCPLRAHDLPSQLLRRVPSVWTQLWTLLEDRGWYWTKGRGLIDFYYVRPHAKPDRAHRPDQDYFISQERVEAFVQRTVQAAKKELGIVDELPALRQPMEIVVADSAEKPKATIKRLASDGELGKEKDRSAARKPTVLAAMPAPVSAPSTKAALPPAETASHESEDEDEDEDEDEKEPRFDIRAIAWKDLWRILRSLGWTWEFGPGHLNYFYGPGFNYKQDKRAVLGVNKFTTEDEVRRFIRRELRAGRGAPWPMLFLDEGSQGLSQSHNHSQSQSQSQLDGNWELVKHRKKRDVAALHNDGTFKADSPAQVVSEPLGKAPLAAERTSLGTKVAARGLHRQDSLRVAMEEFTQAQTASPPRKLHRSTDSLSSPDSRLLLALYSGAHDALHGLQPGHAGIKAHSLSGSRRPALAAGELLTGWSIVMSGMTDELRTSLEKRIEAAGGKVLPALPTDGDGTDRDRLVLISQPEDFRKPKYVQALIQGVRVLHFGWVEASLDRRALLPVDQYLLPAMYSALHSHFVFSATNESRADPRQLLTGLKVMNLTGQQTWDGLLLAAGATLVPCDERSCEQLCTLTLRDFALVERQAAPADVLLFDPAVYVRSVCAQEKEGLVACGMIMTPARQALHESGARRVRPKDKRPFLSPGEVRTLQHCHAMYASAKQAGSAKCLSWPPLVGSVDWLTHSLALREFVDVRALDLFALPVEVVRPLCYKAELDSALIGSDAKVEGGERYCKHDFVYFNVDGAGARQELGKIVGFSRKSMDSALLVRIDTLGVSAARPHELRREGCEVIIPARQLAKKMVVYAPADYTRCHGYVVADEDIYTFAAEEWDEEWPVVDWRIRAQHAQAEKKKKKVHYQPSQDF